MSQQAILSGLIDSLQSSGERPLVLNSSYDNIVFQVGGDVFRWSLSKSLDDVRREADFIRYLHDNDFHAAEVRRVSETHIKSRKEGLPLLVTSYIPHDTDVSFPSAVLHKAAEALYRIHQLGESFCKNNTYVQGRKIDELLSQMDDSLKKGLSPNATNRLQVQDDLRWALNFIDQAPMGNPQTIIHNDFRPQNVLTANGDIAAVIDFDYAIASHTPQKDVAHAALEWSFPDTSEVPDLDRFRLFVEAYAATGNETYEDYIERVNLFDWVKVAAMIDAAGYWLHSPENTTERFGSYMYKKFRYFQDYKNV